MGRMSGYLSGYKKPVGITEQVDILRSYWPNLNPDLALRYMREVYPTLQLPDCVEGPFALIRPGFFSDKYGEELEEVLRAIAKNYEEEFGKWREDRLKYLRQSERTLSAMSLLMQKQPGSDILIIPGQFGIHLRCAVGRACKNFLFGEFGEGAKNVGTMILTHPNRLRNFNDLWLNCPGDVYHSPNNYLISSAPVFSFVSDRIQLSMVLVDEWGGGDAGCVTGFLQE